MVRWMDGWDGMGWDGGLHHLYLLKCKMPHAKVNKILTFDLKNLHSKPWERRSRVIYQSQLKMKKIRIKSS